MNEDELEALADSEVVTLNGHYYIRVPRAPGARQVFIKNEDDPERLCTFFEVCVDCSLRPVKAADIVGAVVWDPPSGGFARLDSLGFISALDPEKLLAWKNDPAWEAACEHARERFAESMKGLK